MKEQEKTLNLYKTQLQETAQSLGDALKNSNTSAQNTELLASTMKKVIDKSNYIHNTGKRPINNKAMTQAVSKNNSIFTPEETCEIPDDSPYMQLPVQYNAVRKTIEKPQTEHVSRHAPPYELANLEVELPPDLVESDSPELYKTKQLDKKYETVKNNENPRKTLSKSVNGMKKLIRTQTEMDTNNLLFTKNPATRGKIQSKRGEICKSVIRNSAAPAAKENDRYKRCSSTIKTGQKSKIRTTRINIAKSPKKLEFQTASEIWLEVWKKYSASFTQNEIELFNLLEPLLIGNEIYKKFNTQYSTKLPTFDPLQAKTRPPDRCGYGLRFVSIELNLKGIIIKQSKEGGSHYTIPLDNIKKPVIPQQTIELIRMQKSANIQENSEENELKNTVKSIKIPNSDSNYYPFYFELVENEKLELLATEYGILKNWVMGINAIANHKAGIEKFRALIDTILNGIVDNF